MRAWTRLVAQELRSKTPNNLNRLMQIEYKSMGLRKNPRSLWGTHIYRDLGKLEWEMHRKVFLLELARKLIILAGKKVRQWPK